MDTFAVTNNLKIQAFNLACKDQAGIEYQRRANNAAAGQFKDQLIILKVNRTGARLKGCFIVIIHN